MFCKPVQFQEFLSHHDLIDDIYKTMSSPDLAEPVMTVLQILKKTNNLPPHMKETKSESKSTTFRNEGNKAYTDKKYQSALICYNQAIRFAPISSRAMKLAYSNRSALLYKIKAFSACLKDIEMCFSMGCPLDIVEKLRKRKDEVSKFIWMEKLAEDARSTVFSKEYFQLNVKRNPQIPCASAEVGVIVENELPKIVATTDIKVGAVLAIEKAFVSINDPINNKFSCYYCHKMNLNLRPCEGCCIAMFCDEDCKETCMREYHSIECKIIEMMEALDLYLTARLATKAVIKMKYMSKSWKEVIQASHTTGLKRLKNSSINETYDTNYKFSLLSAKDEKHFFHGKLYNASFTCACIMHYLDNVVGFFPNDGSERYGAQKATARLLMILTLYSSPTQIANSITVTLQKKTEVYDHANCGWFSFISKIKNACIPNVIAVGINKKIGLVAVSPIKKGTELTVSFNHWLDDPSDVNRQRDMFLLNGIVCNCIICSEDYKLINMKLTDMQRKHFKKLNLEEMEERFNPRNIPEVFTKLCKTMAFLNDMPYTEEYQQVYKLFRRCLLYLQDLSSDNIILDYV